MLLAASYDLKHARECGELRQAELIEIERDTILRIISIIDNDHDGA